MNFNNTTTSDNASVNRQGTITTRRKTLIFLLWAGVGVIFYRLGSIFLWFLTPPRRADEFGGMVNIGPINALPPVNAAPVHHPRGRFWLVHDENGISALHSSCTHLECLFNWDTEKKVFVCPCHGSEFDRSGRVLRGPALKDLSRFPLQIIDDRKQVLAQSDPQTAAPLAIDQMIPEVPGEKEIVKQEQAQVVMLQVDTGSKVSGTARS